MHRTRWQWRFSFAFALGLSALTAADSAGADEITRLGDVKFTGTLPADKDISAVARVGDVLLVGVDEEGALGVLMPSGAVNTYAAKPPIQLPGVGEIDIEGLAASGDTLFVVGSHSLAREKLKDKLTYAENQQRLTTVKCEASRDALYRLHIDPASGALRGAIDSVSLRSMLSSDPVLSRFAMIPSKENGVDIEGLAIKDDQLYVGFRGPVLRENYVPIAVLRFADPRLYVLRYVQLDGDGVRDLASVGGGFLILSGPVGDGGGKAHVYFWDGVDTVPGTGSTQNGGTVKDLGSLPKVEDGKAEGMLVTGESADAYTVLIIYDGIKGGAPALFHIPKSPTH